MAKRIKVSSEVGIQVAFIEWQKDWNLSCPAE